jgi:hypothetical protein
VRFVCRGGFHHVRFFSQMDNAVVLLDPVHSGLGVFQFSHPAGPDLPFTADLLALDCTLRGDTVVSITWPVSKESTSHHITNCFPGCVTLAKSVLGIADWVFTPSQFYRWLLENGGEEYTDARCDAIMREVFGRRLSKAEQRNVFARLPNF